MEYNTTVEVYGIKFDVDFEIDSCRDAYGTGDSPTLYDVSVLAVSVYGDGQDLTDVLISSVIDKIEQEIVDTWEE
jgi:hypothetical protein